MPTDILANWITRLFGQWNTVLFIIMGCSIIGLSVFFERLLVLRRSEIDTHRFILSLRPVILQNNIIEAVKICEETGGAIATIVRAGLMKYNRSKIDIEATMETVGLAEIARLEKNAKVLSIIAHIAPLIGLLGTVLGFIQAFTEMRQSGLMDISTTKVGEAMEYALVTTAAGLVVAIPAVVAYNFLISRIKNLVVEMQITSSEIVELLTSPEQP